MPQWVTNLMILQTSIPCITLVRKGFHLLLVCTRVQFTLHFTHDDVIKWKHFPRNWPFVRGIHRSPVNSPHKGQLRGALMFSLICAWINDWVNNREAGDLRRHRDHYDVIVMIKILHLPILHTKLCVMLTTIYWIRTITLIYMASISDNVNQVIFHPAY